MSTLWREKMQNTGNVSLIANIEIWGQYVQQWKTHVVWQIGEKGEMDVGRQGELWIRIKQL